MKKKSSGFVIITSVLIMSVGLWIILIGIASLHLNEALALQSWRESNNLATIIDGCSETTARALVLNKFYAGQILSWGANSCIINVVKKGKDYQINITARSGNYFKKVNISAKINANNFVINSWQELEK